MNTENAMNLCPPASHESGRRTAARLFTATLGTLLAITAAAGPQLAHGQTTPAGPATAVSPSGSNAAGADTPGSTPENTQLLIELLRQSQNPDGYGTEEYWEKQNQEWLVRNMPQIEYRPEVQQTPWLRIAGKIGVLITAIVALVASLKQRRAAKKAQQMVPVVGR